MHFRNFLTYILNTLLGCLIISSCSDRDFLDKTKIDGSILMGQPVEIIDPIAKRTVLIAQNFEYTDDQKPHYFGLCTGVIINAKTVLTAAHCVKGYANSKIIQTTNFYNDQITKNQIYDIDKIIVHNEYLKSEKIKIKDLKYDIALIQLKRPFIDVEFDTDFINSVPTAEFIQTMNSNRLKPTIAGFGKNQLKNLLNTSKLENTKPINGILEKATVVISDEQYSEKSILIDQNQKSGVCSGDSGGPLYIHRNDQLYLQGLAVAVVSPDEVTTESHLCLGKGFYLNLDFFKDWIAEQLGDN